MTTIKINDKLRKNLKQICLDRDCDYNSLIEEMYYIYNNLFSKFRTESDFRKWFDKNYKLLGYKKILESNLNKTPDFVMLKENGKEERVELEFFDNNFILHKHNPRDVDLIISLFGTQSLIRGVNVFSLLEGRPIFPGSKRIIIKLSDEAHKIARDLKYAEGLKNMDVAIDKLILIAGQHLTILEGDIKVSKLKGGIK